MEMVRISKGKNKGVKYTVPHSCDTYEHEIKEIIFKEDFHLTVTFRDGTVKDVDGLIFINHKRLKGYFDELRNNIELFQKPWSVGQSGIIWTDMADISAEGLWKWGKTIKKATIKKIAFTKIKLLPCGLTLGMRLRERNRPAEPHFRLYKGNKEVCTIAVFPTPVIDRCKTGYEQKFKEARIYINANKDLFIQIYKAKSAYNRMKLAAKLP